MGTGDLLRNGGTEQSPQPATRHIPSSASSTAPRVDGSLGVMAPSLPVIPWIPYFLGGGGDRLGKDKIKSQKPATGLTDRQALPRPGWAVRWAGVSRCLVGRQRQGDGLELGSLFALLAPGYCLSFGEV